VQVDPQFVTISGPADVFQGLDPARGLTTEPISIDGASADVVRAITLRVPEGGRAEPPNATIRIVISPAPTGATPAPTTGQP
jgi:hypothetical protein